MRSRTRPSSLLALVAVALLAFGSNIEPLYGALRDGSIHHESPAAAVAHSAAAPGEHGHEDGSGQTSHHQHGSQHQHGTTADHCTHVHGLALPAGEAVGFAVVLVTFETRDATGHPNRSQRIRTPPPRA
jgi:hypothetical protein